MSNWSYHLMSQRLYLLGTVFFQRPAPHHGVGETHQDEAVESKLPTIHAFEGATHHLDALSKKEPQLASDFADQQVQLYAEFAPGRLLDFLRASNYYSLEKVNYTCDMGELRNSDALCEPGFFGVQRT